MANLRSSISNLQIFDKLDLDKGRASVQWRFEAQLAACKRSKQVDQRQMSNFFSCRLLNFQLFVCLESSLVRQTWLPILFSCQTENSNRFEANMNILAWETIFHSTCADVQNRRPKNVYLAALNVTMKLAQAREEHLCATKSFARDICARPQQFASCPVCTNNKENKTTIYLNIHTR